MIDSSRIKLIDFIMAYYYLLSLEKWYSDPIEFCVEIRVTLIQYISLIYF